MENETTMLKENGRLRKEIANYQNALEAMELRAKIAERQFKASKKKLSKLREVMDTIESETEVPLA